ncbi:MAG TPA: TIGR03118 family protein [Candidatus Sulfotelmatobacter sp.]|nr:TIGR03118 family protein [Candidatus Sulfotelmatobacter sp.]
MQRRMTAFTIALGLALVFASSAALAQYQLSNLSSNQVKWAHHDDPLLVNAWGLVHAPGSPWWVSDNISGWSTLYDAAGNANQHLKVLIPTAGNGPSSPQGLNGPGSPTGIVFNGSQEFQVGGWTSIFLFSTMDGTISGWAPQTNFNQATLAPLQNQPKGAMYTGLAITSRGSGNLLYAADMANSQVEIFDANFNFVKAFTDPTLPAGFTPFGVRDINGIVYVTFASASGASGGFVEQFLEDGTPVHPGQPLIQGAPLNQPWGIAAAPRNFGPLSNTLLISNNTNVGTINAFDLVSGRFVGKVKDNTGKAIVIDQLWGIDFGDGLGKNGPVNHLFFTAGPSGNLAGTFGVIVFKP